MRLVHAEGAPAKRVLLLGYEPENLLYVKDLIRLGAELWHSAEKIESTSGFDLVVSYGYRHLITQQTIDSSPAKIVNLHISLLPWNRGAHPNFWAFFDDTPTGVTIHLIDAGLDTGPIIFQKSIDLDANAHTFESSYAKLNSEIQNMFAEHAHEILNGNFVARPQIGTGSAHKMSDFPEKFQGWQTLIGPEISRLKELET